MTRCESHCTRFPTPHTHPILQTDDPPSISEPNHYTQQRSYIRTEVVLFAHHHHHHHRHDPPSPSIKFDALFRTSKRCCTIFESDRIRIHCRRKMPNESLNLNLLLRPFRHARKEQIEDETTTKKYWKKRSNIFQNFSRVASAECGKTQGTQGRRSSIVCRFARTLKSFEDRCAFPMCSLDYEPKKNRKQSQETNSSSIHSHLHASTGPDRWIWTTTDVVSRCLSSFRYSSLLRCGIDLTTDYLLSATFSHHHLVAKKNAAVVVCVLRTLA